MTVQHHNAPLRKHPSPQNPLVGQILHETNAPPPLVQTILRPLVRHRSHLQKSLLGPQHQISNRRETVNGKGIQGPRSKSNRRVQLPLVWQKLLLLLQVLRLPDGDRRMKRTRIRIWILSNGYSKSAQMLILQGCTVTWLRSDKGT